MTTTTKKRSPASPPAARKVPGARKAAGAAGRTPKRATPPLPPKPSWAARLWHGAGSTLGRQADDVWAAVLLVAALVAGLGIYFGLAGPAGGALKGATGDLLGWDRLLVPVVLVLVAVLLVRTTARQVLGRVGLGCLGVLVATAGLLHLAQGPAPWHVGQPDLRSLTRAGGFAGAVVGAPLRALLGVWGAGVVLTAAFLVSVLIVTGTPVREAGRGLGKVLSVLGRGVARGTRWLVTIGEGEQRTSASQRHPSVTATGSFFDQEREVSSFPDGERPSLRPSGGGTDSPTEAPDAEPLTAAAIAAVAGRPDSAGPPGTVRPKPKVDLGGGGDAQQLRISLGPAAQDGAWRLPPLALLKRSKAAEVDTKLVEALGRTLEDALAAHGVETRLVGMTVGPTVTRYELELGPGVKVARVTSLHKDIAYAMASADVRILAPIPGRSAIGVEVPNKQRQLVAVGDILASPEAHQARHPLEVAMGRDIGGRAVMANLAEMPHILIAGATGAGKSSCINSLITSVLVRATPDQVRLILVDPKRVELGQYNGLPHLLTQVVVNPKKAANALSWAVHEMERRYDLLAEVGVRDITGYNGAFDRGDLRPYQAPGGRLPSIERSKAAGSMGPAGDPSTTHGDDTELDDPELADTGLDDTGLDDPELDDTGLDDPELDDTGGRRGVAKDVEGQQYERLPFILVVVDELNDLMMVAARDVEESICRIAQMARAVGIHLVIATQRPSVDVITGVIKANIPSRLAFAVSSLADSRVILDQPGAERLIGQGDMLLLGASSSVPRRIQGAWVGEDEVRKVVAHWRRQSQPNYVQGVEGDDSGPGGGAGSGGDGDDDDLLEQALDLVVRNHLGSTSMLQRKLRVGFVRAGRLMDLLEQRGVVGPSEGSKARAVLMTVDELEQRDQQR
ncbi:MAG: DNA translocase FtsK 4TM domain-containing protein [Acidimicrobiales bacterium]